MLLLSMMIWSSGETNKGWTEPTCQPRVSIRLRIKVSITLRGLPTLISFVAFSSTLLEVSVNALTRSRAECSHKSFRLDTNS